MKAFLKWFYDLFARLFGGVRDLFGGRALPECVDCGQQLDLDQSECPRCAEEERKRQEKRKKEAAAVKPLVLTPLGRGQANPFDVETGRPRLAIDLGTSASAVGFLHAQAGNHTVHLVDFGQLGDGLEDVGRAPTRSLLVGSQIFDGTLPDEEPFTCLGRTATKLHLQDEARGWYHTSVKRALEANTLGETGLGQSGLSAHLSVNLQRLVVQVFTELLLLAVVPAKSATWRNAVRMAGGDEEAFRGVGLPRQVRTALEGWIPEAGVELYITVPNSFTRHELDVLRDGAEAAAGTLFDALDVPPDKPIKIHTLREAEAIAWWEQSADPDRRAAREKAKVEGTTVPTERWLVFDMGAGTTDLALVEVHNRDIRLIRRSGVPLGGDDVDLAMLLYLAHEDLRTAAETTLLSGASGRTKDLNVTFGTLPIAGLTPEVAADRLDRCPDEVRQLLKEEARVIKEAWSAYIPAQVEGSWEDWLAATMDLSRVEGKDMNDLSDAALLEAPFWSDRYRLLVHLVTVGCCQPLVDEGASQRVDRVLLSGRAAFLPGIWRALQTALGRAGLVDGDTDWGWPSSPAGWTPNAPMAAKLAVVRGAAVFSKMGRRRSAPARLADAITAEIQFSDSPDEEVIPVIPRNTQLDARGQCRRLYRLTDEPGAEVPIAIHRQRLPEEVVAHVDKQMSDRLGTLRVASTRLCRRPLAILNLKMGRADEAWLGFQVDEQNSRVDLFISEEGDELSRLNRKLVGMPADATNPVTSVHSDWLWGGRLR